jgi:hypothetical protein
MLRKSLRGSAIVAITAGLLGGLLPAAGDAVNTGWPEIGGTYSANGKTGTWQARPTYVTSDAPATHATTAGDPIAGLNHDGVAFLDISRSNGGILCSGALLYDGWSVLTAAHCLTDADGNLTATNVRAVWELPGGDIVADSATIHVHPEWDGFATNGYDVAVVNFASEIDADVPRYDIFRAGGMGELGQEILKVGYGQGGFGETGATGSVAVKRWGKNKWENDGLGDDGLDNLGNAQAQLTYDFDSNYRNLTDDGGKDAGDDEAHDAFHVHFGEAVDLGFGDDEVGAAEGDSGSPSFLFDGSEYVIAGVSSYTLRLEDSEGASSDVDESSNSSWGEFGIDARLADSDMYTFVDDNVIPEPATFALIATGSLVLCLRRRRPTV